MRSRFPGANILKLERPVSEIVKASGKPVGEVDRLLKQFRLRQVISRLLLRSGLTGLEASRRRLSLTPWGAFAIRSQIPSRWPPAP